MGSVRLLRRRVVKAHERDRVGRNLEAAAVGTGTGLRQVPLRRNQWGAAVPTLAAMGGDRIRARSWICGSRSHVRPTAVRVAATAGLRATVLRVIMLRLITRRAMGDRIVRPRVTAAAVAVAM